MYKCSFIILFLLMIASGILCAQQANFKLQSGDLLFFEKTSDGLSSAISDVTQTGKKHNFSHIAIVELQNNILYVWHASSENGVCYQKLSELQELDERVLHVFRLKKQYSNTIDAALKRAKTLLGEPYDTTYILESKGYYCSEYIHDIFASDSIFTMQPMTFKEKNSDNFHPTWVAYYERLGIEIPEGKPGCNPNGMAASEKLNYLGVIR